MFRRPRVDEGAMRIQQEAMARQEASLAEQRETMQRREAETSAAEQARRRALGSRFRGRLALLGGDERGVPGEENRRPVQERLGG
jgi:hypothetical protein